MGTMRSTVIPSVLRALCVLGAVTCLALAQAPVASEQKEVTAEEVVGALEGAYGVHPGERRNHTKSTCALGRFVGRPEAAAYSRSALFAGQPVPVVARFSLAGGDPHASDTDRRAWRWSSGCPTAVCGT